MVAIAPLRPEMRAPVHERGARLAWIDDVRALVIIGVIGAHVSLIYALDVGWYYEERTVGAIGKAVLAAIFSPGLVFGMGLLFFVAGLFTPGACMRKGARRFVTDRLWRLGVPVVAYIVLINPAMNVLGDRAMGIDEGVGEYFRGTYLDDVELGIAWFMLALLVFSAAYAGWRWRRPLRNSTQRPLQRRDLTRAVAFIAVASFGVRLVWPFLATGEVWGLNLWEYPQMITLFALGALAEERGWLSGGLGPRLRRTCGLAAAVGVALTAALGAAITLADDPDPFLGGLRLEATIIPLAEATIAVGMSLWVIDWFQRHRVKGGTLSRALGRGSFTAYLVHAPITVLLAVAARDVEVAAEIKFVGVFALAVAASYALGWLFTRSRSGTRIL